MGRGRPTKYETKYANQAYKLCLLGATDAELAEFFEVDESTINNWKLAHYDFLESIKKGKQIADGEVADRLHQRAIGYEHPDVDIKCYEGQIIQTPIIKYYPPDTTAAIFWLKNRQPQKWRDKQVTEHEGLPAETNTQPVINVYTQNMPDLGDSPDDDSSIQP